MSLYNQEFNKDQSILRYILVATLADLKDRVYYYDYVDDDKGESVYVKRNVPFYYSVTGDERFLQDNFLYDTVDNGKAIGDYEVVPRGVLQLNGVNLNIDEAVNRYVEAKYVKEDKDGILRTIVVETNFIPLTLTFDATIVCTNNIEMFKITESLISKLYKNKLFYVDLGMITMQAMMSLPEDFSQEKPFEFEIGTKKEFQVTYSIEVKTFLPVLKGGILLSELSDMVDKFFEKYKDNNSGVLTIRSNSNNELTICSGNIIETFVDSEFFDIKENKKETVSNKSVISFDDDLLASKRIIKNK